MSPPDERLQPGDPVFHPKCGFGTVHGLERRDPARPQDVLSEEVVADQTEEYYAIHLLDGGTLLIPVKRADSIGLRRVSNGMAAVKRCLCSPAQDLPSNSRERAAALWARGHSAEPTALAQAVRDMLAQSRGRSLSASEKTWLDKSCEYLSIEAALVDHVAVAQTRTAIWETVEAARKLNPD